MKTFTKISKAILLALLATALCIFTAIALAACNNDTPPEDNNPANGDTETTEPVTKKYSATLDANVVMGSVGTYSMASVFSEAYVTDDNGSYTLTLTFKVGEIEVLGTKANAFVDNAPPQPATAGGITDGTIGAYKEDGTLVTDGVKLTYSSGDNYALNNQQAHVYFVKSAALPVDGLKENYQIALFVNSSMRGAQFSKDVRPATVKLDLASGEEVTEISGLGVETRGTVTINTEYEAALAANVTMGPMGTYNFGDVLKTVYVTEENGEYVLTLIFTTKSITVSSESMPNIPAQTANLFVDDNPAGVQNVSFGVYDGDELVTDGVVFTYGKGYVKNSAGDYVSYVTSVQFPVQALAETYDIDLYVHSDNAMGKKQFTQVPLTLDLESGTAVEEMSGLGNETRLDAPYAVETMTFTVAELEESYNLALYVSAFNSTAISGMQFPYTSSKGVKSDAVLTIAADGEAGYTATLHAIVNMGQNVDFAENLLESIAVEEVDGGYEITLTFCFATVNMPFGNVMTGYVNGASNTDYFGNVVEPVFGYYDGETLVTDGVKLTYSA
ncbi:MAG: hypothetical protein K2I29_02920 [Clostridia bacterium]|nr:hypothetical protein [Clostridia bacterium]